MFGDIDISKLKPRKPQISLCKPNLTTVAKLKEAYGIGHTTRLADLNEITISIPYYTEVRKEKVLNPHIEMLRERFLLKVKLGKEIEYYIITSMNDNSDDEDVRDVKAVSLGYQLRDKTIESYEEVGITANKAVTDALAKTNWSVGKNLSNPDHYFNRAVSVGGSGGRSFSVSGKTALDFLIEIAEAFNALIVWDTVNKVVDFELPTNIGKYKGLKLSYGKYLQSVGRESNTDEMVTRLTPIGSEGLTIHSFNPTGSGYIEDFSYFMFPFERDGFGNTVKSSHYMSDDLCHAILNYKDKVEANRTKFSSLLDLKTQKEVEATALENQLFSLLTEYYQIDDALTTKKAVEEYGYEYMTHNEVAGENVRKRKYFSHTDNATYIVMAYNHTLTSNKFSVDGFSKSIPVGKWSVIARKDIGSTETMVESTGSNYAEIEFIVTSVKQTDFQNATDEQLLANYNVFIKQEQLNAKEAELNAKRKEIEDVQNQIISLNASLSVESNFTPELIVERNEYIIEKQITNDSLLSAEELYNFGVEEFEKLREPQVVIDIDIVNFLEIVESWRDWDKLTLGDEVKIHHERLGIDVTAKIIEIDYSYEDGDIKLKIANVKDIKTDEDKLIDALYGAVSTSTTVESSKFKWNKVEGLGNKVGSILDEPWDVTKRMIQSAQGDVVWDRGGFKIISRTNPDEFLVATSGVLAITRSGGKNYENAITTKGIIGERIIGKILIGENLLIQNSAGSFLIDDTGITITDSQFKLISSVDGSDYNIGQEINRLDNYIGTVKTDLQGEVGDVRDSVGSLELTMTTTFRDGVIDDAEKLSIKTHIDQLKSEKSDIDKRYSNVYSNPYLKDETGITDKADLLAKKTDFDTKHNDLINAINTAIADSSIIDDEKANVESKFLAYNVSLGNLSDSFEKALDNISKNKAKEAEGNSKTYTDNLKKQTDQDISDVAKDVSDLGIYVDGSFKDGVISDAEKKAIAEHIKNLDAEKKDIDARYTEVYNNADLKDSSSPVVTDKANLATAKTNYNTAHTNLISAINTTIADGAVIADERANFESKFMAYSTALGSLATAFDKAINNIAENKKKASMSYADGLKQQIDTDLGDVDKKVGDLNAYVDGSFKDGVIDTAEAKAISTYINSVNTEKADVDSRYTNVVNNVYLKTGTIKTDLTNKKTSYDTAHTDLINAINTAIADGKTTSSEKATVDSKFGTYKTALSNLSDSFEKAIDDIAKNKASEAEGNAKTYAEGQAQAGKDAWSKFSGSGNTLPAGAVLFGNGLTASQIEGATVNFNNRNDRIATVPKAPVVGATVSGAVVDSIDHTVNTDGSVDISFEWDFDNNAGLASNIDGFIVYVMQGASSGAYSFGTSPASETVYYVTPEKRAIILYGVPANRYYTFGVQSYRIVDKDINASGVLKSAIIKDATAGHNPYRPSVSVAFNGSITGTIVDSNGNAKNASEVADKALGSLQQGVAYNNLIWDANTGFMATRSDNLVRTIMNATSGIAIQKFENNNWVNKLYADGNGNLNLTGNITMLGGSISWANVAKPSYTAKEVGATTEDDVAKMIKPKVRYVRDWLNGSTANTGNHWAEIQVMSGGTNRALNKVVTANTGGTSTVPTDGNTSHSPYYSPGSGLQYLTIDLGAVYDNIDYIQVWHYWADGRTYYNTKTEVSEDGVNWIVLFDSAKSGTYRETSAGKTIPVNVNSTLSKATTYIDQDGLYTGTIGFNQANGGTMTLGGSGNGNGLLSLRDASNSEIIKMDSNGITMSNGGRLVGGNGVVSMFIFESVGVWDGWSEVGKHDQAGNLVMKEAFFYVDIPSNFTVQSAVLEYYSMPSLGGDGTTTYRHANNLNIYYKYATESGFWDLRDFEPKMAFNNASFTNITTNVWGAVWSPSGSTVVQKNADVTGYVKTNSTTTFKVGSSTALASATYGSLGKARVIVRGYYSG